jgi:hypothetical protein
MALWDPIMTIFMPPKRIGYSFNTSLNLDAKNHNGGRFLCIAYRGPLFIQVDEMMVDHEVAHLVDCANLPCREGRKGQVLA